MRDLFCSKRLQSFYFGASVKQYFNNISFNNLNLRSLKRSIKPAKAKDFHEKCPYSALFLSAFSRIWTEYGEIRSSYSVRMRKNVDQNNPNTDIFYAVFLMRDLKYFSTIKRKMCRKYMQSFKSFEVNKTSTTVNFFCLAKHKLLNLNHELIFCNFIMHDIFLKTFDFCSRSSKLKPFWLVHYFVTDISSIYQ